jgi:ketosteroid isomerase-like protein
MTEASIKAIIESVYRHRLANDLEACLSLFSPDAVCRIAGSPEASPIAASCQGTAALRQLLSTLITTWEWKSQKIDSILIQDNRAVVHFQLAAIFKPTETPVNTEIVDILTVRDGKVTSFVEFVDTAHIARIVG